MWKIESRLAVGVRDRQVIAMKHLIEKTDRDPTAFEMRVYDAVREVPPGRVTTYREVAERIGCGSSRAVGQALRRNPFAPEVPCHRVIRSDMTMGGFKGREMGAVITEKIKLLEYEGVRFREGKLSDSEQLFLY